eukprot:TRINITY_DN16016_c0_g2_i1.p1 TRINITY_DN16016_c0_g2~~TRINITY_DN16016_c0_g2_i1.p1  ORF type:complete len:672 (+),score=55.41 TRINITY_DN16016_c0_g2_i1:87-2018(+)
MGALDAFLLGVAVGTLPFVSEAMRENSFNTLADNDSSPQIEDGFTNCISSGSQRYTMIVGRPDVAPEGLPEMEVFQRLKAKGINKFKYNSGISLPGGGGRAYPFSLGAYKALDSVGLLKHLRYTTCSSASCWASAMYTFSPYGDEYFPEIKHPSIWSLSDVEGRKDKQEGYRTRGGRGLWKVTDSFGIGLSARDMYTEGPWPSWNIRHIFRYSGMDKDTIIAADETHARYLQRRLIWSGLKHKIVKPRSDEFPYLIMGVTILGLKKLMPFVDPHQFQHMDASSLYCGTLHSHLVHYKSGTLWKKDMDEWTSGILDTFAWGNAFSGSESEWRKSLSEQGAKLQGCLNVEVKKPTRLLDMLSAASAAPAGVLSLNSAGRAVMPYRKYVSISAEPPYERRVHKWYFGDTGSSANNPIYSLLQRKVRCALAFVSPWSQLDIEWAKRYISNPEDPAQNPIITKTGPQIDWSLAAFFGVNMTNAEKKGCGSGWQGCTLAHHQIFARTHLKELLESFVASAERGQPLIHAMNLVTLKNDRWGIQAGHRVRVTFVYLSVPKKWELDVQVAMTRLYNKPWNWTTGLQCNGKSFQTYYGIRRAFPFAPSLGSTFKSMCHLFSSFLYQLAGNQILDNQQTFRDAVEHEQCLSDP